MRKNKHTRQVTYIVQRDKLQIGTYVVYIHSRNEAHVIKKRPDGWYACTCYHKTLRDAIIYCAYGW